MITAVYTIALNEEKHAERFMQSAQGADIILVGDTGSEDRTPEIIQDYGGHVVNIHVSPWRFDIPRNTVLSLLPANVDFCMALDLDETLPTNWRDIIDQSWKPGEHDRLRFRYAHSVNADGTYGTMGMKDFAHSRKNYMWRHAVHETLYYTGQDKENVLTRIDFTVEHRQDLTKSRASYVDLLLMECNSLTVTPRHVFWLAREYIFLENWEQALYWFNKFLEYDNTWDIEQAHAYRWIAKCYAHTHNAKKALAAHFRSIEIAPQERPMWLDLAWYYHGRQQWAQTYAAAVQGISISTKPEHYLAINEAWGYKIHMLAAIAADKLKLTEAAKQHIATAIRLEPTAQDARSLATKIGLEFNA